MRSAEEKNLFGGFFLAVVGILLVFRCRSLKILIPKLDSELERLGRKLRIVLLEVFFTEVYIGKYFT